MSRYKLLACALTALALSMTATARPAEAQWDVSAGIYLWALGLDGTMTVQGVEAETDVPFSDIFDALDFAFSLHLEARKDKHTIFGDIYYADLSQDLERPTGEYGVEMAFIELGGAYRSGSEFEVLYGLRYIVMDAELTINPQPPGPLPLPPSIQAGDDVSFVDPFAGFRWIKTFGRDKWTFRGRFDAGGFGVSDGSDLALNLQLLFDRRISPRTGIIIGYRWFDLDYEDTDKDFAMDVSMTGPVIAFRWGGS